MLGNNYFLDVVNLQHGKFLFLTVVNLQQSPFFRELLYLLVKHFYIFYTIERNVYFSVIINRFLTFVRVKYPILQADNFSKKLKFMEGKEHMTFSNRRYS